MLKGMGIHGYPYEDFMKTEICEECGSAVPKEKIKIIICKNVCEDCFYAIKRGNGHPKRIKDIREEYLKVKWGVKSLPESPKTPI